MEQTPKGFKKPTAGDPNDLYQFVGDNMELLETELDKKQGSLGYTPAKETGIKNTGTSGGTAFVIEETDSTKRPAIFLTNDRGRAGFFWYGSDYSGYGGKFRIHLDAKSDVLFTNVSNVLVDGKTVYHEGNLPQSDPYHKGTTPPTNKNLLWIDTSS